MLKVLISGDRNWTNENRIREVLLSLPTLPSTIIEGECIGADLLGRKVAEDLGIKVLPFPADWDKYGRSAGPIRNGEMLKFGSPDLVLAFHNRIKSSRGTRNMITQSLKKGVKVILSTETESKTYTSYEEFKNEIS